MNESDQAEKELEKDSVPGTESSQACSGNAQEALLSESREEAGSKTQPDANAKPKTEEQQSATAEPEATGAEQKTPGEPEVAATEQTIGSEPEAAKSEQTTGSKPAAAKSDEKTASDTEPAKTESVADSQLPAIRPKAKQSWPIKLLIFAWIPLSFILPCALTYLSASADYIEIEGRTRYKGAPNLRKLEDARNESLRSGAVGTLVALVIFGIWSLYFRLDKENKELKERWAFVVLLNLAFLLWLVWTCSAHFMIRAHDEVNDIPAALPGLDTD